MDLPGEYDRPREWHIETRQMAVQPFFFGTGAELLFGCYHAPGPATHRTSAVVLCYPMGEEYIRFHRAWRYLAARLAEAGFPALRFDYYGCGNSAGDFEHGSIDRWRADVSAAIGQVRRRCGVSRVCLIGLRLGATLSMVVAAERADVNGLVLWDPVVSGPAHVAELAAAHKEMLAKALVMPERPTRGPLPTEVLGFPLTHSLVTDLEQIDLLAVQQRPANNVLIISSHKQDTQRPLEQHLRRLGARVAYQRSPIPDVWEWNEDVGRVILPSEIVQATVAWMSAVYP